MRRWLGRRLRRGEEGISLIWLAMTLLLLIGMAGFGTDLGWIYLSTARAQKAVDAAVLAGVVNLPGFPGLATVDAQNAAKANGYDVLSLNSPHTLTLTPTVIPGEENRLLGELQTSVEPFFMKAFGFTQFNITREATAQYVLPLPLDSPGQCFGQTPSTPPGAPGGVCPANINDFWGAVSGPYTRKHDGDPYSTRCVANSSASSCSGAGNNDFSRGVGGYAGYYFGVEVFDAGVPLEVWLYDARFDERPNYPDIETADSRYSPGGNNVGVQTRWSMRNTDPSPYIPDDNGPATCSSGPQQITFPPNIPGGSPQMNSWYHLCTIANPSLGIYPLHVESLGSNGSGTNNYSVMAFQSAAPTQPRVYGINDMSIFSNNLTAATKLFLVDIAAAHAGKKVKLEFFDAGDAQGFSRMSVIDPFGNVPVCSWKVWNHDQTVEQSSGSGSCSWITSNPPNIQIYNNQWIVATIDLPPDPLNMCDSNATPGEECFWSMSLNLSDPNERTTWRATVIGNPVRLVPPTTP